MKTSQTQNSISTKDAQFQLIENRQSTFILKKMQIQGLEHIQNNLHIEEYCHKEIKIEKFGYLFKKEDNFQDGYQYDRTCPLCSNFVLDKQLYLVYNSKELKRKFMGHYQCLCAYSSQKFQFVKIPEEIDEAVLRHDSPQIQRKTSLQLSCNYYATITLSHPISNAIYLHLDKNISNQNDDQLFWSFGRKQPFLYTPNILCIPYMNFKCTLLIDYKKFTKKHQFLVNLNKRQSKKKSIVHASTSNITLQFDVITDTIEKESIVSQMNYIYPFAKNFILVRLNYARIRIPEELEQVDTCNSENKLKFGTNTQTASVSSPTFNTFNHYGSIQNQQSSYYPHQTIHQTHMRQYLIQQQFNPIHQQFIQNYSDIDDMIKNGKIKQYVETSIGSRQFQKYLKKCSNEQVQQIINISFNDFGQFIMHQYANYMFQGLINVCSPQQRNQVINRISIQLPILAQNKKGTHSLQTLIAAITTQQQAHIVCKSLEKDFIMLSQNSNATHLIQKIIQTFNIACLNIFFKQLFESFARLSKNAFGICVLKIFMKKIHQDQKNIQNVVTIISQNLDVIIQDPYGNYIVQHAYQVFGKDHCQKITQKIINKFTQYCIQKFSANVVQKCILNFCQNIYQQGLASILQADSLEQILKTPSGNSILLKLMKQCPNKQVEDKISKVLSLPRMIKYSNNWDSYFYSGGNNKAATCRNVYGQTYNNFSQAAQMARNTRPKKGSYTPKDRKY